MKHLFLFVLFTISLHSIAQKDEVLVPFRKGELMGLSNLKGKIVLEPKYAHIEPMGENFFKFLNYTEKVDSTFQSNGQYKKYNTRTTKGGVIAGKKEIIKESDYTTFLLVPEGFIVGAFNNYTKDGGMFYNKSGKKLLNDGVLSYRFVSFASMTRLPNNDHSAIIVVYNDRTYNILDFKSSTQEGNWIFNKNVNSLVLDEENSGDSFFVFSYVDKDYVSYRKKMFFDTTKDQLVIEDFYGGSVDYGYTGMGEARGEGMGEASEYYIASDDYATDPDAADTRPTPPQAKPKPKVLFFTRSENGSWQFDGRPVSLEDGAKVYAVQRTNSIQNAPLIYRLNGKYGMIYTDSSIAPAIYDSLIYLKNRGAYDQTETCYLAGLKQDDGAFLFGVFDMKGEELVPFEYSSLLPGLLEIALEEDEKEAVPYFDYKAPTSSGYSHTKELINGGLFTATRNGYMGLINLHNEVVLPIEYQLVFKNDLHFSTSLPSRSNYYVFQKNGKYGVFTMNGNKVVEKSPAQFPFIPVFYFYDYAGVKGLRFYNLALPDNLFYCLASEDGKVYMKD